MRDFDKIKKIAELMTETDNDVQWDIDDLGAKQLWIAGFCKGAKFVQEVYDKAINKVEPEEVEL